MDGRTWFVGFVLVLVLQCSLVQSFVLSFVLSFILFVCLFSSMDPKRSVCYQEPLPFGRVIVTTLHNNAAKSQTAHLASTATIKIE